MLERPKNLPKQPGVYLFYNQDDQIIYIGKAKSIATRIASYFNNPDAYKVSMILDEAVKIETIPVSSELEALHLEANLIKKYQPKFNTLLKEGNPFLYLFFSGWSSKPSLSGEASKPRETRSLDDGPIPTISIVRTKTKKGDYIGPFLNKKAAHGVYNFLMKTFKLKLCKKKIPNGCLEFHIGLCSGFCLPDFDLEFYKLRLHLAQLLVSNSTKTATETIDNEIQKKSDLMQFEQAKSLLEFKKNFQDFSYALKKLETMPSRQMVPDASQNLDLLAAVQARLFLKHIPYVIDCFDISHLQGTFIVGSCIRYVHGLPEPKSFRRFQVKSIVDQDDYAALAEIVQRRYKTKTNYPNLIVVDGGKGQISAIKPYIGTAELVGLAKREETIISADFKHFIRLDRQRPEDLLLLQIRDKTHQFAISYHRKKRTL